MDTQVIEILTKQNDLLSMIYALMLFAIGVLSAVGVLVLMYKFIRLFF